MIEHKKTHLILGDGTLRLNVKNSSLTEEDFLHSNLVIFSLNKISLLCKKGGGDRARPLGAPPFPILFNHD